MEDNNHNLIECSDHLWSPWHVTCEHVIDGLPFDEWVRIDLADDDLREIDADWVCEECADELEAKDLTHLKAVCMHCMREIKLKAGCPESEL